MAEALGNGGDKILREAVRQNLDKWLKKLDCSGDVEKRLAFKMKFVQKLRESPVAIETARANEQHYEVPTDFFRTVLGNDSSIVAATGQKIIQHWTEQRTLCLSWFVKEPR